MDKTLETLDNGLKKAVCTDGRTGEKELVLRTEMRDTDNNIIGLHIISDDGTAVNRSIEDGVKYGFGNDVAVALDALMNTSLPIGTEFKIKIQFKLPEETDGTV